jgi:hypothetical protein
VAAVSDVELHSECFFFFLRFFWHRCFLQ